ncbi:hypothetical protein [Aliikangiella maris]|uniref:Uncharacterized protein n=2 Tax=Aliikangiella maris TaxID=3162458 RepID=A0ABV2BXM0_9GAMM
MKINLHYFFYPLVFTGGILGGLLSERESVVNKNNTFQDEHLKLESGTDIIVSNNVVGKVGVSDAQNYLLHNDEKSVDQKAKSKTVSSTPGDNITLEKEDLLSFERKYLTVNSEINGLTVSADLQNKNFSQLMLKLAEENYGSYLSYENKNNYRHWFVNQHLVGTGDVSLNGLECGEKFCMAEVNYENEEVYKEYLANITSSEEYKMYTLLTQPIEENGIKNMRFFYTIDPELQSISFTQ